MREQLDQLFERLDRSPALCVSVSSRTGRLKQDDRFVHWSPLAASLSELGEPGSSGSSACWRLLEQVAGADAGCGAAVACFVGMAIGDALGHPLEFTPVDARLPDSAGGGYRDVDRPCLLPEFQSGNPKYHRAFNKFVLQPGQWTDDTSMALCMADSLLVQRGYHGGDLRVRWHMWWTHGYCNAFRHDKARPGRTSVGLGGNIAKSLAEVEQLGAASEQAAEAVPWTFGASNNDAGNGSIMRLAPVPVAYRLAAHQALDVATLQSLATHPGPEAAACSCFMTFFVLRALAAHRERIPIGDNPQAFIDEVVSAFLDLHAPDRGRSGMREFWRSPGTGQEEALTRLCSLLRCTPPSAKEENWDWRRSELAIQQAIEARHRAPSGRPDPDATYNGHPIIPTYFGAYCLDGLAMALWGLWNSSSLKDCIHRVVNLLGDADTTGAIAGQLAGALYGWKGLTKDQWGADNLRNLQRWDRHAEVGLRAALLFHCFPKPLVQVKQAEGHPATRVFSRPEAGSEVVGEIPNGEQATVSDEVGSFLRVTTSKVEGWVGAKNTVDVGMTRPPPLPTSPNSGSEGMASSAALRREPARAGDYSAAPPPAEELSPSDDGFAAAGSEALGLPSRRRSSSAFARPAQQPSDTPVDPAVMPTGRSAALLPF
mmetsp:Transcript_151470/g.486135  ORF Transcript_151470/g.486135 Transcript_151470/m.486135 type:complete len:655 (-) Transcript_151470:50-2014(-)